MAYAIKQKMRGKGWFLRINKADNKSFCSGNLYSCWFFSYDFVTTISNFRIRIWSLDDVVGSRDLFCPWHIFSFVFFFSSIFQFHIIDSFDSSIEVKKELGLTIAEHSILISVIWINDTPSTRKTNSAVFFLLYFLWDIDMGMQ